GLSFAFADVQAKLRYDFTPRQSGSLTLIAGDSRLRELPEEVDESDLFVGNNRSAVLIAGWRTTLGRGVLDAGVMAALNAFDNHTIEGVGLEEGATDQISVRTDLDVALAHGVRLETGLLAEQVEETRERRRIVGGAPVTINTYRGSALRSGGYLRVELDAGPRLTFAPGARIDHLTLTGDTQGSPWIQAELKLPRRVTVRAASGIYRQFPDFEKAIGAFAAADIRAERAVHADVSLEHRISPATRVQLTLYNRDDSHVIRRPGADTRVVDGHVVRGSLTDPFVNRARGYARGVELLVQRTSPTALSGWVSYAYGRNRYEDTLTADTFWGDLDQRHTLNAYVFYRFSHRFSASAKFRAGSNFPVPGYYTYDAGQYFLTDQRNTARLPGYARLDLRANRTFDWTRRRLTLFVEVLNVLNRENVRFNPPRINSATREVTRLFDSLVPVVPSAGLLFEF
ncbi:MAG: TonB-dependent receptor plug domain-containing protein, partial [Vicinamibacterales bacterium]